MEQNIAVLILVRYKFCSLEAGGRGQEAGVRCTSCVRETLYFSSKNINCPHCNSRHHRNGTTTYFHGCVIPAIVSPNMKQVISLQPEFIKKQDGYKKQDCENAAVKRWLNKNPSQRYENPVTLLGDDLYSRQPKKMEIIHYKLIGVR